VPRFARAGSFSSLLETLLRESARSFAQTSSEIIESSVAHALDEALERIETKGSEVMERIGKARGVAQKHRTKRRRRP